MHIERKTVEVDAPALPKTSAHLKAEGWTVTDAVKVAGELKYRLVAQRIVPLGDPPHRVSRH
jgi:hypothetical protein